MRGLCLATRRFDEARDILLEWSNVVSAGMLPNRFPDQSDRPEYNSVDASLWYIIAAHDFLTATQNQNGWVSQWQRKALQKAIDAILTGYSQGTRYGIRMEEDGLLAAGIPGVQLTWMDAKVGDWVVTPRIGKPVEVEALWLNALWIGSQFNDRWQEPYQRGVASFRGVSGTNKAAICSTLSMPITKLAKPIRPFAQIRFLPWAACPFHFWTETRRVRLSMLSKCIS